MRVKYVLLGISLVAVGVAWALTHKHPYKTHANREAAAGFSTQACTANTVMSIIDASPQLGHGKTLTQADLERNERVFRARIPIIVKPLADKLRSDPETLGYLHELGLRTRQPFTKKGIDYDLKRELNFFAKEVIVDLKTICPHALPPSTTDEPYAEFAIITIVNALGELPPPQQEAPPQQPAPDDTAK